MTRSIVRRGPAVTVAVALRDRPWPAVVADMVEGVVAANRLAGVRADHVRAGLWRVATELDDWRRDPSRSGRPPVAGERADRALACGR